jgi:hypothetical protein
MKQRYLEVTFRKGKPLAAYFYLLGLGAGTPSATLPLQAMHGTHFRRAQPPGFREGQRSPGPQRDCVKVK